MKKEACTASIKNHYTGLTRTERSIADYILGHTDTVVEMSVAELAEAAGTAGSAVIRFAKSIGYNGFSQMRLSLARELAARPESVIPLIKRDDTTAQIAEKVFDSGVRTLQNTLSLLNAAELDKLAKEFESVGKIYLFGVGTSSSIVRDMQYRLLQLGYLAACYTDVLFMPVAAMGMGKGDMAIAVSHSGCTKATLEALKLAKERGALAVAVTSYRSSPLAGCAEYTLTAYPDDMNYPVEAVSARLAHTCLLDALYVILAVKGGQESIARLQERNEILKKIRNEAE